VTVHACGPVFFPASGKADTLAGKNTGPQARQHAPERLFRGGGKGRTAQATWGMPSRSVQTHGVAWLTSAPSSRAGQP